jgi:hypothetical protein
MSRVLPHVAARSLSAALGVLALLAAGAAAQWTSDPAQNTAVATKPGEQVLPKVAAAPDGATWIAWFDNASGKYDVYAQRLDAAGNRTFAPGGLLVSNHPQSTSLVDWDLLADTTGAAVLVFTDTRVGADLDVFAYRIAQDGSFLWGPDGVQLAANNDYEPAPRVAECSDGDFAFVWARLPSVGDGGLMLQRLAPDGSPRYPGALTIVTQPGEDPAFSDVAAADGGAIVVSWVRDITTFVSNRHVRARKFKADGTPAWPSFVAVYDAGSVPIAHQPGLAPDGAGGALLWWHHSDLSGIFNSFAQHLDGAGTQLWPHNGVTVSTVTTQSHIDPTLSFDAGSGDSFIFWNERNALQSQWGISGQRLDAAGTRQWGSSGLVLLPLNTIYKDSPRSVPRGDGALVFVRDEPTGLFGKDRVLGLRLDAAGNELWGATPLVVSSVLSTKSRLPVAIGCEGAARLAWEDDRNGTPDVYAQSVLADATLGAAPDAWSDAGSPLSGTHGAPTLAGSGPPCAGGLVTLALGGALENSTATLVVGLSALSAPFKGGTLVPNPDVLIAPLPTGPAGALELAATFPAGLPAGLSLWFQYWIADPAGPKGFAASNAVQAVTL